MMLASRTILFALLLLLALLAGAIALQIHLCRRPGPWPGLVLPGLTLLFSLVSAFQAGPPASSAVQASFGGLWLGLLLCNLPTLLFMAIYFVCHKKQRARDQLKKVDIQNL